MIEAKNLTKTFGNKTALNNITFSIGDATIFGLVGSNGAGKSTFLRVLAGVYKADGGSITIDGEDVFENPKIKGQTLYISDYPYFFPQATIKTMISYYKSVYPNWDEEKFKKYHSAFPLDLKMKIEKMSKGMQRQAALILGLATKPKYILFDEIFDGLDPVIREILKKSLSITSQKTAPPSSSHRTTSENLRICATTSDFCTRAE